MQKDIENKVLKEENKKLEKELAKLRKEKLKDKAKIEFLEKRMPSCMNLSIQQMKIQTSKKAWKNEAYNVIYFDKSNQLTIKEKCSALFVNYSNYAKWKIKFINVLSLGETVVLKRKFNEKAVLLINEFTQLYGTSGSRNVSWWISTNKNQNVSYKVINELRNNGEVKLPSIKRPKKIYKEQRGNVVDDLICNNFTPDYNLHKIGMDGSFMDLNINGKPIRMLGEFAYNWYNRNMISYNFGLSENTNIVLKTIGDVIDVINKYKVKNSILQTDRGVANASYAVKDLIDRTDNLVLSMSRAGFKHNAPTESLNGWFKDCFFADYGDKFDSIEQFKLKFDEFIIKRNNLQTYIYNKKRDHIF